MFSTSFVSTVLIIETRKNGNKRRHIDPIHQWDVDRGGSCGGEKLAGRLSRKRVTVGAGLFYSSSGKSPKSHADRLRYLSDFNADTRTVELTGQGYFEVTKNAHKPFIVKADKDYSVEVLGTSFNVSAYKDESMIETTLVEGSVKLNVVSGGKRMTQMLKPNEKAEYQKGAGKIKVFDVNTEYDTAWKNGEIIFRNHPMDKVLKTLERHYHVVFEVKDNEILKSIITARFKDEQLPQVLEYLKLASGIQYAIHKPTVKDSGSGTSVVEISK